MTLTAGPVQFDPFSDAYFNDPSEMYRRLRDEAPVSYNEQYGFYALSRFADVLAAHRDWEGFSERARHRALHPLDGSRGGRAASRTSS